MKWSALILGSAFGLALVLSGCSLKTDTKAAEAAADRFHRQWNTDDFKTIYDEAHANFRNKPAGETAATFKRVKEHYGQFKSGTKRSWGFNTDNGVTSIKLKYDSTYERGEAVEAFVFRLTGDKPLLVTYDIMSPENAAKREAEEKAERELKRKESNKPNG